MKIKYIFNFHGKYSVSYFFPVQKLIFWPFLKWQKMDFGEKEFFREIDLFDFTSFLAWLYCALLRIQNKLNLG